MRLPRNTLRSWRTTMMTMIESFHLSRWNHHKMFYGLAIHDTI